MPIDGEEREEETDRERSEEDSRGSKECEATKYREEYHQRMESESPSHQPRSEEVINHSDCNNTPHEEPRCWRRRADNKQIGNTRYKNERGADAGNKGGEGGNDAPEDAVGYTEE